MFKSSRVKDLSPAQVKAMLDGEQIVLIDVREPSEFAAERIHGALNFPLSTFDPDAVPVSDERPVVFQCGSGKRSATAVERCLAAGVQVDSHLKGGIGAWRAAGLPTIAFDPATGALRDPEA